MDLHCQSIELDKLLDLDKLIHERVRLGIMAALSASDVLSFQELKSMLKVTDGNLSVHLKLLEKSDYVTVYKNFRGRKPQSTYRLTSAGRMAFKDYITSLENFISKLQLE